MTSKLFIIKDKHGNNSKFLTTFLMISKNATLRFSPQWQLSMSLYFKFKHSTMDGEFQIPKATISNTEATAHGGHLNEIKQNWNFSSSGSVTTCDSWRRHWRAWPWNISKNLTQLFVCLCVFNYTYRSWDHIPLKWLAPCYPARTYSTGPEPRCPASLNEPLPLQYLVAI